METWVEKHRPESLDDIAGNRKAARQIRDWAEDWEPGDEPLLLYGPAGTGKTSSALAVADEMGWDVVEMNASDVRTKDAVERIGGSAATTGTLTGTGHRLVLIDEVDNLHGNRDRGGSGAMTELVKEAGQPVIMICNDRYEVPDGVRNRSEEIQFKRLQKRSILSVLKKVRKEEDIVVEKEALETVAAKSDGDLRSAINDLESVAISDTVRIEDVSGTGGRDRDTDIFETLDTVLKKGGLEESKYALLDLDETPDDLIHWVDQGMGKVYDLDEMAEGYRYLSLADKYLGYTWRTNNYGFWSYTNDMMAGVSVARKSSKGGWTRYGLPSYWSKLGRTKKARNLRDSISRKVADAIHVSTNEARDDVMPFLSILMEEDDETGRGLVEELDLEEDEVEFLVDEERAAELYVEEEPAVQEIETEGEEEGDQEEAGDDDDDSQSSLGDF